jgi:oleandomycin transport system permease protein
MSSAPVAAGRIGLGRGFGHARSIARRNLLHIKADPEQMVGITIQPIMFLCLFVYVFGGAMLGSSKEYLQFALPGILVQMIGFSGFTTALGLNKDFDKGVIDRFRSLPIARSAVVAGRIFADVIVQVWSVAIIVGVGTLMGFRFHGGLIGALGSVALILAFGFTMCWPMAFIGIKAKAPEAVNTLGFMIILPLTFASTVFAPKETMPGWLQGFVGVNPITHVSETMRGLMQGGPVRDHLMWSVVWMVVLIAVFAPLAVRGYKNRI